MSLLSEDQRHFASSAKQRLQRLSDPSQEYPSAFHWLLLKRGTTVEDKAAFLSYLPARYTFASVET
ncbi:hypothetical protein PGT21_035889 [Puccinia graminis f. sp. tritici]|uniref:Uncharacterized protein n=1 Tax=Puccinia graminis f. sp. tritici TaxID=56615 RepID=A0A5B0QD04_PUCGR|nr:hypothetical protein PGT21_035889 [Puccinia graminis f. sp. tritici]